jgi:hypothetical protein
MGKFERNDAKRGGGGSKAGGKVGHGGKGGKSKGGGPHKGKPNLKKGGDAPQQRHKKVEITFDPTGRREYLTGFSARKKERRAFGLAMQKVKDREAKLVERKEQREAQLEKMMTMMVTTMMIMRIIERGEVLMGMAVKQEHFKTNASVHLCRSQQHSVSH